MQRLDRRRGDDPFHPPCQVGVQGYQGVCLQLSECNVLSVVGLGPPQLLGDVPGPTPEHGVAEEPDRHPPDAREAVARDVGRDLAPPDGLVQSRQRLGTKKRRREQLVRVWDFDSRARQVEDRAGVDDGGMPLILPRESVGLGFPEPTHVFSAQRSHQSVANLSPTCLPRRLI